jgi:hypothetical protein
MRLKRDGCLLHGCIWACDNNTNEREKMKVLVSRY